MTEETIQEKPNKIKTWEEVYEYDDGLEMDFEGSEDVDIPRFSFCDI